VHSREVLGTRTLEVLNKIYFQGVRHTEQSTSGVLCLSGGFLEEFPEMPACASGGFFFCSCPSGWVLRRKEALHSEVRGAFTGQSAM
jgi:hypothetical protein